MRTIKFHQNFTFDRERLAVLIRCTAESQVVSKKAAAAYMGVGEPAAEGCIGWLIKVGLGTPQSKGYGLTPLGNLVAAHDAELRQTSTLWLLHYYLATDHDERAEIWHRAFNEFLSPGMAFTRDALQIYVERSLDSTPANKSGVSDDCKKFIKGYIAPTALGKLDLVREVGKDTFEAGLNNPPDPYIFAFALFDAWLRRFPHTDTLRVTQVCEEPELPGKVFAARRDQVVQLLQVLQSLGLVNIVDSQHEPVTRRFREVPYQLLETYYAAL